jgi:excisionase family DNA binding protein
LNRDFALPRRAPTRPPVTQSPSKKVLTVEDVADYMQVHKSTIYRLLRQHRIPAFKVGTDWRFNIESIDEWRKSLEDHDF